MYNVAKSCQNMIVCIKKMTRLTQLTRLKGLFFRGRIRRYLKTVENFQGH